MKDPDKVLHKFSDDKNHLLKSDEKEKKRTRTA